MKKSDSKYWVDRLSLISHQEGGYFRQMYLSDSKVKTAENKTRSFCSFIYYLLEGGATNACHKLKCDETWVLHAGSPFKIYCLAEDGELKTATLGLDISSGQQLFYMIPAGTWMFGEPTKVDSYSLLGITASPGYNEEDFMFGRQKNLVRKYPKYSDLLNRFCITHEQEIEQISKEIDTIKGCLRGDSNSSELQEKYSCLTKHLKYLQQELRIHEIIDSDKKKDIEGTVLGKIYGFFYGSEVEDDKVKELTEKIYMSFTDN